MTKTVTVDPAAFRKGDVYRFPFTCIDPMPGGSNLGRIEWHVEPLRATRKVLITSVLVWASQTRDNRYQGKVFSLPCRSQSITSSRDENDYLRHVWQTALCLEHKTLSFSAYPANQHTMLVVECISSIGNRIYFQ